MNLNLANLATAVQNLGQSARNFEAFLKDIFQMDGIFEAELLSINAINDERLGDFDFKNAQIYAKDLQKGEGLGFVLVPTKTHKKRDLVLATRAINRAHAAHMIVFFISSNSSKNSAQNSSLPSLRGENFAENSAENFPKLSIAFATRRFHKNRKIDTDVIDKITLIKDIDIFRPSHAHLLNLHAIATIAPSAVNAYYQAILEALSVSALNKRFYVEIFRHFIDFINALKLPNLDTSSETENESVKRAFILRLICRILFCKFLEKKGVLSAKIWDTNLSSLYYHEVLTPLFFATLNTPKNARNYALLSEEIQGILREIPYLNGGLFSPQRDDFYSQNPHDFELKLSNELFANFFKMLDNYHFTIDEASSEAQEVALDPELLGQIFESLLSELFTDNKLEKLDKSSLRKDTGSYYTPREIVRYMVKSSLESYLKNALNLGENLALNSSTCNVELSQESQISLSQSPENRDFSFATQTQNDKIFANSSENSAENSAQNLHKFIFHHEICPEILAQKEAILHALNTLKILDPACGSGAFPMGILQEILALQDALGDEREHYERKLKVLQNSIYGVDLQPMATEISRLRCFLSLIIDEDATQIKALPNLEFKFISANTLLPLSRTQTLEADDYILGLQELQALREAYFTAHDKDDLQKKYKAKRDQLAKLAAFDDTNPLLDYDPFDTQNAAKFFDSEWMFGVKDFDIVIGNPPYGAKITPTERDTYKKIYKISSSNTAQFFIINSQPLLKPNGVNSFIVPKSLTYVNSWKDVRNFMQDSLCLLVDCSTAFDGVDLEAVVYLRNKGVKFGGYKSESFENKDDLIEIQKEFAKLFDIFVMGIKEKELNLGIKIKQNSPLSIFDCGESARGGMFQNKISKNESDLMVLGGKEIQQYFVKSKPKGYVSKNLNLLPNAEIYQNSVLVQRIISPKHNAEATAIRGTIIKNDTQKYRIVDTIWQIVCNADISNSFILGLLHSKLMNWYCFKFVFAKAKLSFQFSNESIARMPIPQINSSNQNLVDEISRLVETILEVKRENSNTDTSNLEGEIDILVYKLYNLTENEIEIVERN